jgi:hypothetical protein
LPIGGQRFLDHPDPVEGHALVLVVRGLGEQGVAPCVEMTERLRPVASP